MERRQNSFSKGSRYSFSAELLVVLHWLMEYESEKIKKIISKAYQRGLKDEIDALNTSEISPNELHDTVANFFQMIEHYLDTALDDYMVEQTFKPSNVLKSLEKLDAEECNKKKIKINLQKTIREANSQEQASIAFFEEVLRQWKPDRYSSKN